MHLCMQHIAVTVAEQQLMIHGKVCSKGTGSSSLCKLALKAIVEQTILYYYLPYELCIEFNFYLMSSHIHGVYVRGGPGSRRSGAI